MSFQYEIGSSKSTKQLNGTNSQHSKSDETRTSPSTMANGGRDDNTAQKNQQTFPLSFYNEALKILVRIYLSVLKAIPVDPIEQTTNKSIQLKYIKFLRENFSKVYSNHISQNHSELRDSLNPPEDAVKMQSNTDKIMLNSSNDDEPNVGIVLTKTPILFLSQRPAYLDDMSPISDDEYFCEIISTSHWWNSDLQCENDLRRKAILTIIKLQVKLIDCRICIAIMIFH